ncbi:hypothetical protein NDU88_002142 [Pleurodeles waltl]|uniref:Uncharacterized protein n=1 Tax=Pleurodeles waltl TaxID=8319 RepID=A0AAV7T1I5_PLEWA|nr:hypothetical protein NDU88_002142 [Pleurodeles waltl]
MHCVTIASSPAIQRREWLCLLVARRRRERLKREAIEGEGVLCRKHNGRGRLGPARRVAVTMRPRERHFSPAGEINSSIGAARACRRCSASSSFLKQIHGFTLG